MGTVVFDFDSTLVSCESLELALARAPGVDDDALRRIEELTRRGMEGELPFHESLRQRLAIARPTRESLRTLGEQLACELTDGASDVVTWLHSKGHAAWIVSGGFREVLVPAGRAMGIDAARVCGVSARWTDEGELDALVEDGFDRSKVEGVRRAELRWPGPVVGVGDGSTDLALREAGLVDDFVAYCEHVRRESVVERPGVLVVENMGALWRVLERLLA
jgi:HAD superfamily phosphoserine phosphatase-like hydrolase